jgi:hypothetical protein
VRRPIFRREVIRLTVEACLCQTYVDFPPQQKPGSFSLDQVQAKLQEAGGAGKN